MAEKKLNGNVKFYLYIAAVIATLAGSYAIFGRDVSEMKPAVKLNTEHRISDEATDKAINDKLNAILAEVTK